LERDGFFITGAKLINNNYIGTAYDLNMRLKVGVIINFAQHAESFKEDVQFIKQNSTNHYADFSNKFMTYLKSYDIINLYLHHTHENNGDKTAPDGFCGYRSLYQLYYRLKEQNTNPLLTHHQLNIYCENKDPQLTIESERESFIAFLRMLKESNLNEPIFNTAIDKVLHFIENVRKYRYQMFEVTTNAWMNEDWLIQSIQNHFTTTGSLLLPYAPLAIKHFPTLAQVNASSISYNVNSLFSYYDVISILSGVFISYAGSHYGVEPIHIIEDDIYWFNDALVNVCDKLYKLYFNN
jgi:hypothetical protein